MRYTILLLLLFLIISNKLFAQNNYEIKGIAADSVANSKLVNTTIAVLNAKDSILIKFTRATQNGSFRIGDLGKGKFILLVSYPGYADYVENFSLDSLKPSHNFGTINMQLKSRILKEVMIKGTAAQIKIKGDTTEFNAAAYTIQPNAKVEDLLKQLPGMQVDKDGKITAQGQTVNKVLVDGEEFFGDDPTLVTKNLRADMVDKVQLYDKKSDQAAFTGIDDGKKTKTINIKLKEDKKNGYFGKLEGGAGTDGYYTGQVLYNRFKAKQKFSLYGIFGNDGKTGLGWQDSQKYGETTLEMNDDGMYYINGSSGDDLDSFNGTYNGQGIPTANTGGVHYDDKFDKDKQSININYKIGSLAIDGVNTNLSQNNIPDDKPLNTSSDQKYHNYIFRQKLDLTYKLAIDTTSTLKLTVSGTSKNSQTNSKYSGQTIHGDTLLNNSTRDINNKVDGQIFNAAALYTKKFKKKGRTFSLNVSEAYNDSKAKGTLVSDITYYRPGKADSPVLVNQYKTNDIKSNILISNMTYSEPLSKSLAVLFNYGITVDNSTADRRSFNQSAPGVYNILDSTYSNNYRLNQLINQQGAIMNYKKGKIILNFGTKVSEVAFKQINEYTGGVFKRNFINWSPQASLQYHIKPQKELYANYQGSTDQPTVDQIQPVLNNTDPLNVLTGNPDLTPSFTNRFYLYYSMYKVISEEQVYANGNFSFTSNPIVLNTMTDQKGKTTSQYTNLSNSLPYNFYTYIYYGRKISGIGLNIGAQINVNGNKSYNISNSALNASTLNTYGLSFNAGKYVQKKYDFNLSFGPTYTFGGSSLQKNINNNGHGFTGYGQFNVYLPSKFQIGSNANYEYNSATQTFGQDFSRVLLNAYISKSFFKGDNLKITAKGNDLLNQNAGFNRSVNGNLISQSYYTTIKRYFMLTVTWDFNKVGGGAPKQ